MRPLEAIPMKCLLTPAFLDLNSLIGFGDEGLVFLALWSMGGGCLGGY